MEKQEIGVKSTDFHKFLKDLCDKFKEKCDTDNEIPLRHPNPRITPPELEGECLNWAQEYLSTRGCPAGFNGLIAREVYKRVSDGDLRPFYTEDTWKDSPRIDDDDKRNEETQNKPPSKDDIEYDAEKLYTHVLGELETVCLAWLNTFPQFQVDGKQPTLSYHAIKNTRRKMEDRHVMIPDLNALFGITDQPAQAYFGIFDGHAGTDAATFTSKHIHCNLVHECGLEKNPAHACKMAFKVTDDMFIPKAKKERWRSGTTGVTALVRGDRVFLSWLGDSQAVLIKNGKCVTDMEPHKPDRMDERERIEALGGFVIQVGDLWRVGGNLAVSRAIGDVQYKPFVSGDAEVLEHQFDGTEEYLVLACDGLWDAVTPEELPRVIYNYMQESGGDAAGVAKYLTQYAKDNESMDNISVIVLFFRENLTEPIADAGLFTFLGGGSDTGSDNSQGSNDSGKHNKSDKNDKSGGDNQECREKGDNSGNSPEQGKNNSCQDYQEVSENENTAESEENARDEKELAHREPEMLVHINHMSFDLWSGLSQNETKDDTYETSTETEESYEGTQSPRKEEDLDNYGVFNTRLVDGPIDLSFIKDVNTSELIRNIADDVYNLNEDTNMHLISIHKQSDRAIHEFDREIENSLHNYLSTQSYVTKKKGRKPRSENQRPRKDTRGKGKGNSPVCWAFTGKNRATVKNHKLNMAAKTFNKGTNPLAGDSIPTVKPTPSKFAQVYSSTENVHDIANVTLSHGKLESLPPPHPKVLPNNLAHLSGFKVFGSTAHLQKESQKFHTTWRPRKPLKPISSTVYETPPTPFVNSKLQRSRQQ